MKWVKNNKTGEYRAGALECDYSIRKRVSGYWQLFRNCSGYISFRLPTLKAAKALAEAVERAEEGEIV